MNASIYLYAARALSTPKKNIDAGYLAGQRYDYRPHLFLDKTKEVCIKIEHWADCYTLMPYREAMLGYLSVSIFTTLIFPFISFEIP